MPYRHEGLFQESGPGSDGSPHSYVWVRHTLETHGRSRLLATSSFLAFALIVGAIAYLLGNDDLLDIGIMFATLATILVSYSISVRSMRRPLVSAAAKPGALSLRHRPVLAVPTFLAGLSFSVLMIIAGFQHSLPEAALGGIASATLTISLPVIAYLQSKRAFLHLTPDYIRVTTIFNDSECNWENILHIRATDHRSGVDTIGIAHKNNSVTVHRQTPGFAAIRPGQEWEFSAKSWGASLNSLLSTLIFLRENPDIRQSLDESRLRAMLEDPSWAVEPRPARARRCLNSFFSKH
ncbi:hypothetical protein [Nocardia ignorata]|uniref:Uncharacterized protein n=1 Tax=Nocardia ignorata TaxID=145285 RepID=A0A4V3CMB2_NOCIG|nr:hypothetical protein [Nocardia ignorata]TDP27616.1 hypothetical protein DFR75_1237 [Nocardia ignorata]